MSLLVLWSFYPVWRSGLPLGKQFLSGRGNYKRKCNTVYQASHALMSQKGCISRCFKSKCVKIGQLGSTVYIYTYMRSRTDDRCPKSWQKLFVYSTLFTLRKKTIKWYRLFFNSLSLSQSTLAKTTRPLSGNSFSAFSAASSQIGDNMLLNRHQSA